MRNVLVAIVSVSAAAAVAAAVFAYSGIYNVAADDPHWDLTTRFLETVREQSVARRAQAVGDVPDLDDPQLVLKGAGQYAAMCVNCHLAPGVPDNQLSRGLYPRPPRLNESQLDARKSFVVIKHGLKMSGMPAWGGDHGDDAVWSLVAFALALPKLDAAGYQDMVRRAPPDEEMHGGGSGHAAMPAPGPAPARAQGRDAHGGKEADGHDSGRAPGHHGDSNERRTK